MAAGIETEVFKYALGGGGGGVLGILGVLKLWEMIKGFKNSKNGKPAAPASNGSTREISRLHDENENQRIKLAIYDHQGGCSSQIRKEMSEGFDKIEQKIDNGLSRVYNRLDQRGP